MDVTRRTELQLAGHPFQAFYWPLIAAYVYSFASGFLLAGLAPQLLDLLSAEGGQNNHEKWMHACVLQGLILVRMSMWVEKVAGEPFGAPVRASLNWYVFAVIAVPFIHWMTFGIIGDFVSSGEGDWTVREDFDASMFTAERYSLMLFYTILLAPIVEEVGFRGILLGFLRGRGLPDIITLLITAAGFALLHTQYTLPAIGAVFILGLVLGWLRIASNSIGPPILAHIAVNAFVSL